MTLEKKTMKLCNKISCLKIAREIFKTNQQFGGAQHSITTLMDKINSALDQFHSQQPTIIEKIKQLKSAHKTLVDGLKSNVEQLNTSIQEQNKQSTSTMELVEKYKDLMQQVKSNHEVIIAEYKKQIAIDTTAIDELEKSHNATNQKWQEFVTLNTNTLKEEIEKLGTNSDEIKSKFMEILKLVKDLKEDANELQRQKGVSKELLQKLDEAFVSKMETLKKHIEDVESEIQQTGGSASSGISVPPPPPPLPSSRYQIPDTKPEEYVPDVNLNYISDIDSKLGEYETLLNKYTENLSHDKKQEVIQRINTTAVAPTIDSKFNDIILKLREETQKNSTIITNLESKFAELFSDKIELSKETKISNIVNTQQNEVLVDDYKTYDDSKKLEIMQNINVYYTKLLANDEYKNLSKTERDKKLNRDIGSGEDDRQISIIVMVIVYGISDENKVKIFNKYQQTIEKIVNYMK